MVELSVESPDVPELVKASVTGPYVQREVRGPLLEAPHLLEDALVYQVWLQNEKGDRHGYAVSWWNSHQVQHPPPSRHVIHSGPLVYR